MQRLVLTGIVAFAFIAFAYAETACQNQRRNAQSSAHSLQWNITCDENGDYHELQCTVDEKENKRWCSCYNKEEAYFGPSRKLRTCVCQKERQQDESIQCAQNGKFKPKQCSGEMCRCVNPETGATTTAAVRNQNLEC